MKQISQQQTAVTITDSVGIGQRDRAYEELRRLLILQQVPEGERLREPEWSERLGVNRVALREAFARLEAECFLEKGPKTGYFVPVLAPEDIEEILEVRAVLECAAVERICAQSCRRAAAIVALERLCEELAALIHRGYLSAVSQADRRFHEALVELAGSRRLLRLYRSAPLPLLHGRLASGTTWEAECRSTLVEHRALVQSLAEGNVSGTQQLLKTHLHGPYLTQVLHPRP